MTDQLTFPLGDRLRLVREKAGLTPDDMADAFAMVVSTVYNWESGRVTPTPRKVRRWADVAARRSNYALTDILEFIDIDWVEKVHERRRTERRMPSRQPKGSIKCMTRPLEMQAA